MPDKEKIKHKSDIELDNCDDGKTQAHIQSVLKEVKHVPKDEIKPHSISVLVEVPMRVDAREFVRAEIGYLKNLMQKYPGPTERFYNEAKSA